ncbi:MAG: helix-turn-helix domain-containing protein [Solirubrobacteraceae bacterium]
MARKITPPQHDGPMQDDHGNSGLGETLRQLRQGRGLSLNEVGAGTGISPSFLSLVENGRSDITIGRLTRLVEYFKVSITDILPTPESTEPDIVRASERRLIHSPAEGIDVYMLGVDTRRSMMPMLLVFEPGAELAEYGRHPGEEFVHVLTGKLRLTLTGSEPRLLGPGDSAYYPGDRMHLFANASDRMPLKIICVDSPPNL